MSASIASPLDRTRPGLAAFLVALVQLALLLASIRSLRLEESLGLVTLTPLVFVGFCVHAWLPARAKLPFFLLLSLATFLVILGPGPAAILVLVSLGLVGLCHAPVPFGLRVALLLLAGAVLALLLTGRIPTTWAATVVPVVGAMFMFRAAVYLYDLRTENRPASPWLRLSYFFLFPNACFLLFPVVDYRTFQRTYYERPADEIHQRGLRWILRGIVHLLLYRVVYLHLTPTAAEVQDLAGVVRFVLSSFLLFLRISGHFHLIVGLLHLFGFHLPETNHRYFLASSFTDCWRRINVYWTEFMKKLVYFPAFARLRRRGTLFGMVGATSLVFVATWGLHAYQWFWLHGALPQATDGLFWAVAGGLAVANLAWEARRPTAGRLAPRVPTWGRAARRSLAALAIFSVICVAWSLWCSPSPAEWAATLSRARHAPGQQLAWVLGSVAAVLVLGTAAQRVAVTRVAALASAQLGRPAFTAACALALVLLPRPSVQGALGPEVAGLLEAIRGDGLNERDRERLVAGYYDRLIERESFGGRVSERTRLDPDDPEVFRESPVSTPAEGPLQWELAPSARETFEDAVVATNSFGMRDREYALEKPAGTVRIAVLGACYEMGTGVANEEVWEAVAEEILNRELAPRTGLRYELLNFSVAGYDLLQLVTVVREKVPAFQPDLVLVSSHVRSSVGFVLRRATDESSWPEGLAAMVEETRGEPGVDWEARLEAWAFARIAEVCAQIEARPVLLNVPAVETLQGLLTPAIRERIQAQLDRAQAQGYVLLDLNDAFAGETYETVALPQLQRSPSPAGHRLLARRFCEVLLERFEDLLVP